MDFEQVIASRRSIRAFKQQAIPSHILEKILKIALESPSSSNTQPYKVAIAQEDVCRQIGETLKDKYWRSLAIPKMPLFKRLYTALTSDAMPNADYKPLLGKYPAEFQSRRVATGKGLYSVLGIERKDRQARDQAMAENFTFFGAPVALFFFVHPGMKHTSLVDLGIMMQSIMLAATNQGLGSCAQGALGIWRDPVEQHFLIPNEYKLVCGMALGYPEDNPVNHYRPEKLDLTDLLIPAKSNTEYE